MKITPPPSADEPPNQNIAAIVGNGLSITAEPTLSIPSLTEAISDAFEDARSDTKGEDAVNRVLARLAKRGSDTGDPFKDFEAMIGPLDQQRENLVDLRDLAEIVGNESAPVKKAIGTLDTFVESLRRQGVGHALNIIAERSIADARHRGKIDDFIDNLLAATAGHKLVVGNLNYDSMVMASLCDRYTASLCDMADGRYGQYFDLSNSGGRAFGRPLRSALSDFPSFAARRIRLLHLHGSLTWLRNPETGIIYRFEIESLRESIDVDEDTGVMTLTDNHWEQWRKGKSAWEPQVVLTNQTAKSDLVSEPPFSLAYDALYESLLTADRWMLAGYSFRDECVNALLADAWRNRKTVPEIMVVTIGKDLKKSSILDAIGWDPIAGDPFDPDFLHVCRHGIEYAPQCKVWKSWAAVETEPGSAAMGA